MASVQRQTSRSTNSGTLGRALLALVLAFGFWAWVTNQSDPDRERTFENVPVTPINPPDGLAIDYTPKNVTINIWGPRSVVLSPNVQAGNFAAVIDLKDIKPGVTGVPVQINTTTKDIRKKEAAPATVQVTAERSVEKVFTITVPTQPPPGVKVNSAVASPSEVKVVGPQSVVNMVTQVTAAVDLTDRSTNFVSVVDVTARDASGNAVTGVTISPSRVTVTVDLTDQRNERTVPVSTTDFTGTPAPGYQLDSITANPAQVTLIGDPQQLRSIPNVTTESISIDGLNATTTITARLQTNKLPPGVTIKDNIIQVQVTINIVEITSTARFTVPIQPINLRPGLQPRSPNVTRRSPSAARGRNSIRSGRASPRSSTLRGSPSPVARQRFPSTCRCPRAAA